MANNSKKGMIIAVVALLLCCCCCLSVLTGGVGAAFSMSPAPAPTPPASGGASADDGDDSDDADGADTDADDSEDGDEPEGANAGSPPAGAVAKTCTRKVTATRTDSGNSTHGWGMDLRFKCDGTLVHIGRAMGGGPKHKNVNFDGKGCPDVVNKSNWEGTDTYPDHFDVDVSDCVD